MESVRVVFDLDGTLIDSARDIQAAANAALTPYAAPLSLEETRSFVGNGAANFVTEARRARGLAEEIQAPLLDAFLHHYVSAVSLTEIYPGALEALQALRSAGHRLGICTNKPRAATQSVMAHLGLDALMDVVIAGDSLPQRKPTPEPLNAAYDALGAGPRLYVGDTEVDAEAAQAAGVPFALYAGGFREAGRIPCDVAFDDFADLPGLIRVWAR